MPLEMPSVPGSASSAAAATASSSAPAAKSQRSLKISMPRMRHHEPSESAPAGGGRCSELDSEQMSLPPRVRLRLNELFSQIEKEFEHVYSENSSLHRELEVLQEKSELTERFDDADGGVKSKQKQGGLSPGFLSSLRATLSPKSAKSCQSSPLPCGSPELCRSRASPQPSSSSVLSSPQKRNSLGHLHLRDLYPVMSHAAQKLKPAYKLKQQTSKIVSSFKTPSTACSLVREFRGHKDGVWEVSAGRSDQGVIGTASADHTARVWSTESGKCLLVYQGHGGSVNSVRFHPTRDLVVSGSGDQTAHIWQASVMFDTGRAMSSEEEVDACELHTHDCSAGELAGGEGSNVLRTPVLELSGHTGVVIAADWLAGAEQVVTASWDRTGQVLDVSTAECLNTLTGHDRELTNVSAHPTQKFVVTASRDTTFRLWDFREPISCVSVFQGHTDGITAGNSEAHTLSEPAGLPLLPRLLRYLPTHLLEQLAERWPKHPGTVTSAVFTSDDKVVSGSDDRTCKVWDLKNMRSPVATMRGDAAVNRLDVSACNLVAVPFDNRHIRVYDLTGQRLCRLPRSNRLGHRRMVCSVAWGDDHPFSSSSNRPNLFSCGFDNVTNGWLVLPPKDGKD